VNVDIVRVAERLGVALQPSGDEYKGLCPIHVEDTPSFYVNPEKGVFYCFGCGAGGNAITLVAKAHGISNAEAKRLLAKWFGIPLEGKDETAIEAASRLERLAEDFHKDVDKAVDYLHRRGIYDADVIEQFQVGFAEPGYAKDLPHEFALELKLITDSGFETLANRVILPIHTASGMVIGLSGRAISDDVQPKYMTTSGFNKADVLYGLHAARDQIRKTGQAVVVEGQFDVLALHQDGISNAVAALGSNLMLENAIALKRAGAERVIYLADGDKAGIKAMLHAFEVLSSIGLRPYGYVFPKGKDAADFVGELNKIVNKALPEGEMIFELVCRKTCEPDEFINVARKVMKPRGRLDPAFLAFARRAHERFGFSESDLYHALKSTKRTRKIVRKVAGSTNGERKACGTVAVRTKEAEEYAQTLGVPVERVGDDDGKMSVEEEMAIDFAYICILRQKLEEAQRANDLQSAWELRTLIDVYASKWK